MIKLSRPYFLFFTLGDWGGYRYNEQKIMSRIGDLMNSYAKQSKPTFKAALGDKYYDRGVTSSTEDSWDLVWKNIYINNYNVMKEIPWYAILGNHDYYGGDISVKSEIERTKFC